MTTSGVASPIGSQPALAVVASPGARDAALAGDVDDLRQYVTFVIGGADYGVDVMDVREIRTWSEPRALPGSPDYVRGVLELRGVAIPIVDLRCRFGLGVTAPGAQQVVMMVAVAGRVVGILADAVSDILTIRTDEILPVPLMDRDPGEDYLAGLVPVRERMVALLTLDRLLDTGAVPAS